MESPRIVLGGGQSEVARAQLEVRRSSSSTREHRGGARPRGRESKAKYCVERVHWRRLNTGSDGTGRRCDGRGRERRSKGGVARVPPGSKKTGGAPRVWRRPEGSRGLHPGARRRYSAGDARARGKEARLQGLCGREKTAGVATDCAQERRGDLRRALGRPADTRRAWGRSAGIVARGREVRPGARGE